MRDAIVIGSGIMGASIAEALRSQGRDVLVIDAKLPMSGTGPCGGSIKPSPLTGIPPEQEQPILSTLDQLFGLTKETFIIRPSGGFLKTDVWRLDMEKVRNIDQLEVSNSHITQVTKHPRVYFTTVHGFKAEEETKLLFVAAGMGCKDLLPEVFPANTLTAKQGVSFRFSGQVAQPFVQAWAPYKQITVHNIGPNEIWAADGSALKPENWTNERTLECKERVQRAMERKDEPLQISLGLRSFHSSHRKPCFFEQITDRIWVAVGAGKFGCLAAGWVANKVKDITDAI